MCSLFTGSVKLGEPVPDVLSLMGGNKALRVKAIEQGLLKTDFISAQLRDQVAAVEKTPGVTWREKVQNYAASKKDMLKHGKVLQAVPGLDVIGKLYGYEDTIRDHRIDPC